MIGMLQIITYLLCVYLVFKGFEILQIALMSGREDRAGGIVIGILAGLRHMRAHHLALGQRLEP